MNIPRVNSGAHWYYTTVPDLGQGTGGRRRGRATVMHALDRAACQGMRVVAFDGKTGAAASKFTTPGTAHLVSAFAADSVLGHLEIDVRSAGLSSACSVNSGWPRAWSPWMRCIAKKLSKTFERAAQRGRSIGALRLIAQVKANQLTLLGDVQRLRATSTSRSTAMSGPPTPRGRATRHATSRCSTRAPILTPPEWAPVHRLPGSGPTPPPTYFTPDRPSETSYRLDARIHRSPAAPSGHTWGIENRTTSA